MDALTDRSDEGLPPGRRVRIAAFKSGIGPGEPLEPIIEELARIADALPDTVKRIEDVAAKYKPPEIDRGLMRDVLWNFFQICSGHLIRAVNWTAWGVMVAALVAAFGLGYGWRWWNEDGVQYVGIRKDAEVCEQRPDGRLCRIPVWLPDESAK